MGVGVWLPNSVVGACNGCDYGCDYDCDYDSERKSVSVMALHLQYGRSALHCAVVSQRVDIVRALLAHGASVNLQNQVSVCSLQREL